MLSVKPTMADEQSISRVFNGVTLTRTYTLQDGIVTLRTAFGNKTAQLLGSDPDTLASIMLRELYQDIAARGCQSVRFGVKNDKRRSAAPSVCRRRSQARQEKAAAQASGRRRNGLPCKSARQNYFSL